MARSVMFYFGSIIFFIGLLLFALGISKIIAQALDLLTLAELISGFLLMLFGHRATRAVQRRFR